MSGMAEGTQPAGIGFSVHTGWAAGGAGKDLGLAWIALASARRR